MNSGIRWLLATTVIYLSYTILVNERGENDGRTYAIIILLGIAVVNRAALTRELNAISGLINGGRF